MKLAPLSMSKLTLVSQFLAGSFLFCSNPDSPQFEYNQPIKFSGFINGVEVSLGGNFFWPNSCTLKDDTVKMYFYSDNFSENNTIRHGDFMRIFLFPGNDSLIGIKHMIFHLARYQQCNSSYTILPRDTASFFISARMRRIAFSPARKQRVQFEEIYMYTTPISGTTGEQLEITNGNITGAIE